MRQWVVDAFNALGARPDGWWKDRPGALGRLMDEIVRWRAETGEPVMVIIDGRPHPLGPPPGTWYGVDTRYTGRSDRNAADDAIVALLDAGGELHHARRRSCSVCRSVPSMARIGCQIPRFGLSLYQVVERS